MKTAKDHTNTLPAPTLATWIISGLLALIIGISQSGGAFPSLLFLMAQLPGSWQWLMVGVVPMCSVSLLGWSILYFFKIKNYLHKREYQYLEQRAEKRWRKWRKNHSKSPIDLTDKQWVDIQIILLEQAEQAPGFTASIKHTLLKNGFISIQKRLEGSIGTSSGKSFHNLKNDSVAWLLKPNKTNTWFTRASRTDYLNFKNKTLGDIIDVLQNEHTTHVNKDTKYALLCHDTIQRLTRIHQPAQYGLSILGLAIFAFLVIGPSYTYGALGLLQMTQIHLPIHFFYLYLTCFYIAGVSSVISLVWPALKKRNKFVHIFKDKGLPNRPTQPTFIGLGSLILASTLYGSFTFMAFNTIQNLLLPITITTSFLGWLLPCIAGILSTLMTFVTGENFTPNKKQGLHILIHATLLMITLVTSLTNALTVYATAVMPGSIIMSIPQPITLTFFLCILGSFSVFSFTTDLLSDTISKELTPIPSNDLHSTDSTEHGFDSTTQDPGQNKQRPSISNTKSI
ncbi:MAG: hypothetical protein ACON5A_04275 [Candidatus Comchoanobacterales bacterium]